MLILSESGPGFSSQVHTCATVHSHPQQMVIIVYFGVSKGKVLLYSGTPPASSFQVLELQAWITTAGYDEKLFV